jgi:two-component system NtrC family sensor kinase
MLTQTLKFKVGFYVAIALAAAMALFTLLVIMHQRDQLLQNAADHVEQISQLITRSTRYAMLQNQPDYVQRIIQDVGRQDNIAKVRVLSKEGRIIHSTHEPEIGQFVDRKADACVLCHQGEQPLEHVPSSDRSRIYKGADGKRLLGSMEVIRNEPTCYNSSCHFHSPTQSVLGVLDIVYSLDEMDHSIRMSTITITVASLVFAFFAALFVTLFVHRLVYLPLSDLEAGADRMAAGDLEQLIPVRSADEFGKLAGSFNTMTEALRSSHAELRSWGQTLQQKIEERTAQLRVAQAETARSEKLASVGLLAAGIAHELNNPLTGVLTFTTLLRRKLPDGSADAEDLELVIRETKRCAAIIRRLLDFAREKKPEKKYSDLNHLIEETARIVERPASLNNVEIALDLAPGLPPVWLDADLIKQVVMNMLVNAQHAIENGGSVNVRTSLCAQPRSVEPGAPPVPMVEISIIDSGCGIPAQNLSRIFDPFFTSKEVGKGTGLGLAVSHGIVRAHGGTIEVESKVGEGSTFRIFLPTESPVAEVAAASSKVET